MNTLSPPLALPPPERDAGSVPSREDLRRAAASLRALARATSKLPGDSPADGKLQDRLDLAAQVLDAAAEESPEDSD